MVGRPDPLEHRPEQASSQVALRQQQPVVAGGRLGKARTQVKSGVEGIPWKHGPPARYTSARSEVTAF